MKEKTYIDGAIDPAATVRTIKAALQAGKRVVIVDGAGVPVEVPACVAGLLLSAGPVNGPQTQETGGAEIAGPNTRDEPEKDNQKTLAR